MNKVSTHSLSKLLFSSVPILLSASSVTAETINCTEITTLPAIITVQGIYCFTADHATSITSGNAIEIQTNNVTIDFNNFKLGGLNAGTGTRTNGVYALDRKNITLRNANIRGFYYGAYFEDTSTGYKDSGGHIIEDSRFDGNLYKSIETQGAGNSVRRNQILNTGGSTINGNAYGISSRGPGIEIIDNHVHNTFILSDQGSDFGIYLRSSAAGLVLRNRVSETITTSAGKMSGITAAGAQDRLLIQDNQIVNASVTGDIAIDGSSATNSCLAVNNTLINFDTFVDGGCYDGGGNTTF
ncbi:MAG: hypothetical protein GY942_00145 [Aestuariibacter sp.]|nr:hypothetical protein [Aestuariibacter sp.]